MLMLLFHVAEQQRMDKRIKNQIGLGIWAWPSTRFRRPNRILARLEISSKFNVFHLFLSNVHFTTIS